MKMKKIADFNQYDPKLGNYRKYPFIKRYFFDENLAHQMVTSSNLKMFNNKHDFLLEFEKKSLFFFKKKIDKTERYIYINKFEVYNCFYFKKIADFNQYDPKLGNYRKYPFIKRYFFDENLAHQMVTSSNLKMFNNKHAFLLEFINCL